MIKYEISMSETILIWMGIGISLLSLDILLLIFFSIYITMFFGASALTVALLLFLFGDLTLTSQIVIFGGLGVVYLLGWNYFRKYRKIDMKKLNLSIQGQRGSVTEYNPQTGEGFVAMGMDKEYEGKNKWPFVSNEVSLNESVEIVAVNDDHTVEIKRFSWNTKEK